MNPLIGIILAISVVVLMLTTLFVYERHHQYVTSASILGHQLADYMNAAEERMTVDGNLEPGKYLGSAWLKSAKCGGTADKNYLPCHFEIKSKVLKNPVSITITKEDADKYKYEGVLTLGPVGIVHNGEYTLRSDLAGAVISAAKAYFIRNANQFISASSSYALDKKTATATINIVANQINGDVFVRRDGTEAMEGDLKFDPNLSSQKRQLVNVSSISLTGDSDSISASNSLALNTQGNSIVQNAQGTYINDAQSTKGLTTSAQKTIYLGNQSGVAHNSNLSFNDARIGAYAGKYLSDLLQERLHQDTCYNMQIDEVDGQAGHAHPMSSCRVGYYPAGFSYYTQSPEYGGWGHIIVRCCKG